MVNRSVLVALAAGATFVTTTVLAAPKPFGRAAGKQGARATQAVAPDAAQPGEMSVAEAQMTVEMLDDAYQIILRETHRTYHDKPGRPVAATMVRKLQKQMTDKGVASSRFLGVNGLLMNADHGARDKFEREAVRVLKTGKARVETVEKGRLRAATAVPLGFGCTSCHWAPAGQTARAAISWDIPVK